MMGATSRAALPFPDPNAANNVPAHIQALAEAIDAAPGIYVLNTAQRNALTPYIGQHVYDTDLKVTLKWNGTSWSTTGGGIPHPFLFGG